MKELHLKKYKWVVSNLNERFVIIDQIMTKKGVKIEPKEVEEIEKSSENEVYEVIMMVSSFLRKTLETRASKRKRVAKA